MQTLDTNVIVRLLVGDDPQQTPIAERAFLAAVTLGGVDLPDVVLAEVAWVLRGYDLDRLTRHDLLERLLRTRGVVVDDTDCMNGRGDRCLGALPAGRRSGGPAHLGPGLQSWSPAGAHL